jgi:hypothetical protein
MTDTLAERLRKVGGTTIRSIGNIARLENVKDDDRDYVTPLDMLKELVEDDMLSQNASGTCTKPSMIARTLLRRVCSKILSMRRSAAPDSRTKPSSEPIIPRNLEATPLVGRSDPADPGNAWE